MVKIDPVVLEKKMLTHDGRRMTDDDGRQTIAISYLSDSGDLKKKKVELIIRFSPKDCTINKEMTLYDFILRPPCSEMVASI